MLIQQLVVVLGLLVKDAFEFAVLHLNLFVGRLFRGPGVGVRRHLR